jgi:hypothetical protein
VLITPSAWGSQLTGYNHHHQLRASHQSSGKIGFLQYFSGFFLKVGFLHKNKTPGQFC